MGMGTAMPIMNLAVQNEFEQHDLGAATSSSQLFRGLGSTIGTAVLSGILTVGVTAGIGDIQNSAYVQSLRKSPEASQMLGDTIDANSVLQINAQRETISEQANKALDAAPIPTQVKDAQKEQFAKNQTEFKDTVVNAFSDSLHTVFYVSAGLMVLALVAVSFVREKKLRDGHNDAPGVAE